MPEPDDPLPIGHCYSTVIRRVSTRDRHDSPMPKSQMLINHVPGYECRISLVEDGLLEEPYQDHDSTESPAGNIDTVRL